MICVAAARVLHVSLTSEKTEKANGLHSINIERRWSNPLPPPLKNLTYFMYVNNIRHAVDAS